jgi:hypothetical protein
MTEHLALNGGVLFAPLLRQETHVQQFLRIRFSLVLVEMLRALMFRPFATTNRVDRN